MIFNINDKVDYVKEDIEGIVKRRGTNYVVLEDNNNNLHKAWIWDCIPDRSRQRGRSERIQLRCRLWI